MSAGRRGPSGRSSGRESGWGRERPVRAWGPAAGGGEGGGGGGGGGRSGRGGGGGGGGRRGRGRGRNRFRRGCKGLRFGSDRRSGREAHDRRRLVLALGLRVGLDRDSLRLRVGLD